MINSVNAHSGNWWQLPQTQKPQAQQKAASAPKNSALGGLFGTIAGVCANFLKGNKSESK